MAFSPDIRQQVFDLLSKTSNLSFVTADRESAAGIGLAPGQRVTAEVLTTLADSRVQVRIGAERFNLNLPLAVRTGQSLELTFVSAEPRSTFAIARQGGTPPPVSLSDASRLLGLLADTEGLADPLLRSSLQGVAGLLRISTGETGVLANLMEEALTYGTVRHGERTAVAAGESARTAGSPPPSPEQLRLAAFEASASQVLQQIARNSRFILVEAARQPLVPLLLAPGEEVEGAVRGTLPGGRALVSVAGSNLELTLPRQVAEGDILRLTVITSHPRPVFALPRESPEPSPGELSEAGRWLSVLERGEGGVSQQQRYVLERLTTVLKSLPPDSPAFTAIQDEAITYRGLGGGSERAPLAGGNAAITWQPGMQQGSGIRLGDDASKLLQALIRGNRLALLEALNQQGQALPFAPGQHLKGDVLATLGGGRFTVQVAEQFLEFSLPRGVRAGDRLTLFFITTDPRPTFLVTRFGLPGDARVSEIGRWLNAFQGDAAIKERSQETGGILGTLLSGPPDDALLVGTTLREGVRGSGLFYESHLARWFGGEYSLEKLLREPQGRLSRLMQGGEGTLPVEPEQGEQPGGPKHATLEAMEAAFRKAASITEQDAGIDRRALPLVREQLQALQAGQLMFRGELFAGQPFDWTVNERGARRNDSGEQERSWDTVLRLELPHLGGVTARLCLDGRKVAIELFAGRPDSVGLLEGGRHGLVEQLQAAGLEPGEIGVTHDPSR